jgi:anti-sigma regulatory factor (Ser/Thr protein kinase)/DNA-binding transcriptional ArsR family regulator
LFLLRFTIGRMMRVRARGEDIRRFILEHVEKHPNDVARLSAEHFGITRQAVNKHLRRLIYEKALTESGETRKRAYKLAPLLEWRKSYAIAPELEEHVLWDKDIEPVCGSMPENVMDIWRYGFTEMLNNAKDHSGGTLIMVGIEKTAVDTHMQITDNGIGIFKKIQEALNLPDQRYSVLELAKGKLTTDPEHHTGEGVFFSSRMFDRFAIASDKVYFGHKFGAEEDWIFDSKLEGGTSVFMELSNHTRRTEKEIFDKYTSEEDYGFNKTVVPVDLARYGNDKLISRSQAKRVVARLELFKTILFDFTGVPTIGQAFADEIFRVFANDHPNIEILAIHANSEVSRMIARIKSGGTLPALRPMTVSDE